jgi:hypothetical protein
MSFGGSFFHPQVRSKVELFVAFHVLINQQKQQDNPIKSHWSHKYQLSSPADVVVMRHSQLKDFNKHHHNELFQMCSREKHKTASVKLIHFVSMSE